MKNLFLATLLIPFSYSFSEPLIILNWADYFDPEVLIEFTEKTGIEVKEIYYASDQARDEVMTDSAGQGYDLIIMDGLSIDNYSRQGWLEPIAVTKLPHLNHIDVRWKNSFKASKEYAIPYFWGTIGIAYRKDLVSIPITHWQQIFNPIAELQGKITMTSSAREVVSASLKSLGYSSNSTNKNEFSEALNVMKKQSPYVNNYIGVDLDETSALLSGESIAAMMYSGDALMLQELNNNIEYVLPEEGSNIWVDFITVSAHSQQKENAWLFINFINQPKIAAQLANYVYCASPNKEARKLLDQEFLTNPTIFPNDKILSQSEFFQPLPARTLKKLTKSFQQLVN